jgi:hypothetical protein
MAEMPVIVGNIVLQGFEVPETLDALGSYQKTVVHDFPGGYRTIRNLGAFIPTITWKGILSGPDALDRQTTLEYLAATGQQIMLTYATTQLLGEVVDFKARPKNQWNIPYEIIFEPIADLTGISSAPIQPPSAESQMVPMQSNLSSLSAGTASTLPPDAAPPSETVLPF